MKAILVMEMPENCMVCPLSNDSDECIMQDEDTNYNADTFSDLREGCPLIPMSERAQHPVITEHRYICPGCGASRNINHKYAFCPSCGQRLAWGQEA